MSMETLYTELLSIHPRPDKEVFDTVRRRFVAQADNARTIAWGYLWGIVLAGGWALSMPPFAVASAGDRFIAATGLFASLVLLAAIVESVLAKRLLPPEDIGVEHVPHPLTHAPQESLIGLFRAAQPHPELRKVVWEWIRSGHPIRIEQVQVTERYLAAKQVA